MKKELSKWLHRNFEQRAHRRGGVEFWCARELQKLLGDDLRPQLSTSGFLDAGLLSAQAEHTDESTTDEGASP